MTGCKIGLTKRNLTGSKTEKTMHRLPRVVFCHLYVLSYSSNRLTATMTSLPGKLPHGFTGDQSWETAHIGSLFLVHTRTPEGQEKNNVQYQLQHLKKYFGHRGSGLWPGVLEILEFTVRYPGGCNSETGLSKDINIEPTVLLFPHKTQYFLSASVEEKISV